MNATAERVRDDLQGVIRGELLFDDLSRALYSTDASIYQVVPLGVVVPRDADDVKAVARYAAEHKIPLSARGAGSGLAGESLGPGLVLDFSRHMRRLLEVDPEAGCARVQPGLVLDELNAAVARYGLMFGPDPSSGNRATLGGMLGCNATGAHSLRYGYTRDHVLAGQVVLIGGDQIPVGNREPRLEPGPAGDNGLVRKSRLIAGLGRLLDDHQELIRTHRPRAPRHRAGYGLHDIIQDGRVDLARLLVGSEGTLGLFTEVTLKLVRPPAARGLVMLVFSGLESAAAAVMDILELSPAACEILDQRLLTLARQVDARYRELLPADAGAVILVEHDGATADEVRERVVRTGRVLCRDKRLALGACEAYEPADQALLWRIRKVAVPLLFRTRGPTQPTPFVEDAAVPPDRLAEYITRLLAVLKRHEVTVSLYGHAGHGELHTRPFLDLHGPDDVAKMERIAQEVYAIVLELGGSISGEHGLGYSRTQFLREQCGPLYPVVRRVKELFDPDNLLNPGKVISDDPHLMTRQLRFVERSAMRVPPVALRWTPEEFVETVERCNGCGVCRTLDRTLAMCPVFRATRDEPLAPRAKANLLRHVVHGRLSDSVRYTEAFKRIMDGCVHCKMCALECPSGVDIAKLALEGRAAYVSRHGLTLTEWVLSRSGGLAGLASALAVAANAAAGRPALRWLAERTLGIAGRRRLPRFHHRSFLKRAHRAGWTRRRARPEPRVAYFVDLYANYNEPALGEAVVRVLEHNGQQVYVPRRQAGCGMPALDYGDLAAARRLLRYNVHHLSEAVRDGYTIVSSEPTATLMLVEEYLNLTDDPDAQLVAENTLDVGQYLWQLHERGRLRLDFQPVEWTVGYHAPCHLKALKIGLPGRDLLRLVPGLKVHTLTEGCCGMAGTFGLRASGFELSLRAGAALLERLRGADLDIGSSECSTCQMQMEQGADKPTVHPVLILAYAYGLMPALAGRLKARPGKQTAT